MRIDYSKKFIKQLKKVPVSVKKSFQRRLQVFVQNKKDPVLNNHKLKGELKGFRSINVTGDYRAIFQELDNGDLVFFFMIGTHSELYK